jgi:transposase
LARVLPHIETEIVKRSDRVEGFAVLPKRWIVERKRFSDPTLHGAC